MGQPVMSAAAEDHDDLPPPLEVGSDAREGEGQFLPSEGSGSIIAAGDDGEGPPPLPAAHATADAAEQAAAASGSSPSAKAAPGPSSVDVKEEVADLSPLPPHPPEEGEGRSPDPPRTQQPRRREADDNGRDGAALALRETRTEGLGRAATAAGESLATSAIHVAFTDTTSPTETVATAAAITAALTEEQADALLAAVGDPDLLSSPASAPPLPPPLPRVSYPSAPPALVIEEGEQGAAHEQGAVASAAAATAGAENGQGEDGASRKRKDPPTVAAGVPPETAASASCLSKRRAAPTRVSWEDRLEQLRQYKREHGDLYIPIRYKPNPSLGKFVHNTREQYKLYHKRTPAGYKKKCSLTAERLAQLEEIGFVWNTERTKKQNEDWGQRLEQLRQYKDEHGDCLVPHGYKADPSFAEWIHRQRTTYALHLKEGRTNPMIEDRMQKLEAMGFNFRVHLDKWSEHFAALQEYRKQHGHCMVPTHYVSNMKLGRWVHTQRFQRRLMLRGKKSSMTEERVKLLEELGFSWEVRPGLERPRASWQSRYDELVDFHRKHGHVRVPPDTHPQLHWWCHEQKARLNLAAASGDRAKEGDTAANAAAIHARRLGPDRVKALADVGFTKDVELLVGDSAGDGGTGDGAVAASVAFKEWDGTSHDAHEDENEEEGMYEEEYDEGGHHNHQQEPFTHEKPKEADQDASAAVGVVQSGPAEGAEENPNANHQDDAPKEVAFV